jgi:hypothetical protein
MCRINIQLIIRCTNKTYKCCDGQFYHLALVVWERGVELRYWTLSTVLVAVLLSFFALASVDLFVEGDETGAFAAGSNLQVQTRTDTSIAGIYGYGGTEITFTSRHDTSTGIVYTNLVINGSKVLQARKDLNAGSARLNGHDNVVFA